MPNRQDLEPEMLEKISAALKVSPFAGEGWHAKLKAHLLQEKDSKELKDIFKDYYGPDKITEGALKQYEAKYAKQILADRGIAAIVTPALLNKAKLTRSSESKTSIEEYLSGLTDEQAVALVGVLTDKDTKLAESNEAHKAHRARIYEIIRDTIISDPKFGTLESVLNARALNAFQPEKFAGHGTSGVGRSFLEDDAVQKFTSQKKESKNPLDKLIIAFADLSSAIQTINLAKSDIKRFLADTKTEKEDIVPVINQVIHNIYTGKKQMDEAIQQIQELLDVDVIACKEALRLLKIQVDMCSDEERRKRAQEIYDEYAATFSAICELSDFDKTFTYPPEAKAPIQLPDLTQLKLLTEAIQSTAARLTPQVSQTTLDQLHQQAVDTGFHHAQATLKDIIEKRNTQLEHKISPKRIENLTTANEELVEDLKKQNKAKEIPILKSNIFKQAAYIQNPTKENKENFDKGMKESPISNAWNRWKWKIARGMPLLIGVLLIAATAVTIATGGVGGLVIAGSALATEAILGGTGIAAIGAYSFFERRGKASPLNRHSVFTESIMKDAKEQPSSSKTPKKSSKR